MKVLNLKHLDRSEHEDIREVLEFMDQHDLTEYDGANNEVSEDTFFNVARYTTGSPEKAQWESHKCYIDVHVPLSGVERIHHNFLSNLEQVDYDEEGDSVASRGKHASELVVQSGDIVVFYPEDAHQTGVAADGPDDVHKVIFKVKI